MVMKWNRKILMKIVLPVILLLLGVDAIGQNLAINTTGTAPNSKAALDLSATNMGLLIPRVTLETSTDPISGTKPEGLLIYNSGGSYGVDGFYNWDGSGWIQLGLPAGTTSQTVRYDGNNWVASSALMNTGVNVGVGTSTPSAILGVYEGNESATETDLTQTVTDAGILISTDYTSNTYTSGVFWSSQNNNPTKPKAGIYMYQGATGSKMILVTSTDFAVGITNDGVVIDDSGNVGIGTTGPSSAFHINGGAYFETFANVGGTTAPPNDYRLQVTGPAGKSGILVSTGDNTGDIGFRIEDQDGSFNLMDVEMSTGSVVFGETYSWTLTNRGAVYGFDCQDGPGFDGDFNTQNGVYRIAGEEISPYNLGGGIGYSELSSSSSTSTTSSSYTLVNSMSTTPSSGTYIVSFSATGSATGSDQQLQVSLYKDGSKVSTSERNFGFDTNSGNYTNRFGIYIQSLITFNGSETIEVRYKTDSGTFNINERSLILIKVS